MHTSYNFADAQRMLIKPFERLGFVTIFVLTTGLSLVVADLVFRQPTFDLLWARSQMQYGIVTGMITGTFVGASQWLILRKYLSDWKWILVVGLSTTFIATIQAAVDIWKESLLASVNSLSEQNYFHWGTLIFFTLISTIGAIFIPGYLQWYVLRPYVTKARWWIFVPFIALLVGIVPISLEFLTRGLLLFNMTTIKLTVWPATQAIGFCILKKKSISEHPTLQSPLALAPDIVNYWDIQKLEKMLYMNISRIWKTDLRTSIGQLTYLVGVNRNGSIVIYEPVSQASVENVNQTPLPELAKNFSGVALDAESLTRFAKFQVVFIPPGVLQIYSWRGIPLIWLGGAVYTGIIGISILCAYLQIDILTFGK